LPNELLDALTAAELFELFAFYRIEAEDGDGDWLVDDDDDGPQELEPDDVF